MGNAFDKLLAPRLALAALALGFLVGIGVSGSQGLKGGVLASVVTWVLVGGIETTIFLLMDKAERRNKQNSLPKQFALEDTGNIQKDKTSEPG